MLGSNGRTCTYKVKAHVRWRPGSSARRSSLLYFNNYTTRTNSWREKETVAFACLIFYYTTKYKENSFHK